MGTDLCNEISQTRPMSFTISIPKNASCSLGPQAHRPQLCQWSLGHTHISQVKCTHDFAATPDSTGTYQIASRTLSIQILTLGKQQQVVLGPGDFHPNPWQGPFLSLHSSFQGMWCLQSWQAEEVGYYEAESKNWCLQFISTGNKHSCTYTYIYIYNALVFIRWTCIPWKRNKMKNNVPQKIVVLLTLYHQYVLRRKL